MNCPICEKNKTEQIYKKLKNSISSDSILIDKEISKEKLCHLVTMNRGFVNKVKL